MLAAILLSASLAAAGAAPAEVGAELEPDPSTRVVIVLIDDVGPDLFESAETPVIDALDALAARYTVWTYPSCSPTRAALITSQYGFRTGIGQALPPSATTGGLDPDTETVADRTPLKSVWLGKWHVATPLTDLGHPQACGFDLMAGAMHNLNPAVPGMSGFFDWTKAVQGTSYPRTTYNTADLFDDAVRAVGPLNGRLVFVAPNAVHTPYHVPPAELYTPPPVPATDRDRAEAMLEAVDTELGRLVAALGPADFLFVLSDNGTEGLIAPDPSRAKGTLCQVWMAMALGVIGAGIEPGERLGLVDVVDLGPTALELLGETDVSGTDGLSIATSLFDAEAPTPRVHSYSERFLAGGAERQRAIRDVRYKLIRRDSAPDELFDLWADPGECCPLAPTGPAGQALSDAMTALSGP